MKKSFSFDDITNARADGFGVGVITTFASLLVFATASSLFGMYESLNINNCTIHSAVDEKGLQVEHVACTLR